MYKGPLFTLHCTPQLFILPLTPSVLSLTLSLCICVFLTLPSLNCVPFPLHVEYRFPFTEAQLFFGIVKLYLGLALLP